MMSQADAIARLTDSEPATAEPVVLLRRICAWCPDFDPSLATNERATHTICPDCARRVREAEGRR